MLSNACYPLRLLSRGLWECIAYSIVLAVQHDYLLVLLAAAICAATTFTSFSIYSRVAHSQKMMRLGWLFLTGVCTASGIWATHFVAMLAYKAGAQTAYDPRADGRLAARCNCRDDPGVLRVLGAVAARDRDRRRHRRSRHRLDALHGHASADRCRDAQVGRNAGDGLARHRHCPGVGCDHHVSPARKLPRHCRGSRPAHPGNLRSAFHGNGCSADRAGPDDCRRWVLGGRVDAGSRHCRSHGAGDGGRPGCGSDRSAHEPKQHRAHSRACGRGKRRHRDRRRRRHDQCQPPRRRAMRPSRPTI